jgi:methylmalonyl-CoA mutase N-terminal domain/subunit
VTEGVETEEILKVDPKSERDQVERLGRFKEARDAEAVRARLEDLREVAVGEGNLLYPIRAALAAHATLGEVSGVMREEYGEYQGA